MAAVVDPSRPTGPLRAWRPAVDGVHEVLHARFGDHAYPMHAHDAWTVLLVDVGAVRYDLDRHEHGAVNDGVTVLPPFVAHNGRAARPGGFRKRVLYLDRSLLDDGLIGAAVDRPTLHDVALHRALAQLHDVLAAGGEEFEASCRLSLVTERLAADLHRQDRPPAATGGPVAARRLRELLDAHLDVGVSLAQAARTLDCPAAGLVRAFRREYGLPPHRYLTGRRVETARRYLLAGHPAARAATLAGFYDQAHLTRHFTRLLGTTPARYARSGAIPAWPGDAVR